MVTNSRTKAEWAGRFDAETWISESVLDYQHDGSGSAPINEWAKLFETESLLPSESLLNELSDAELEYHLGVTPCYDAVETAEWGAALNQYDESYLERIREEIAKYTHHSGGSTTRS